MAFELSSFKVERYGGYVQRRPGKVMALDAIQYPETSQCPPHGEGPVCAWPSAELPGQTTGSGMSWHVLAYLIPPPVTHSGVESCKQYPFRTLSHSFVLKRLPNSSGDCL